jgi:hypothetical protein
LDLRECKSTTKEIKYKMELGGDGCISNCTHNKQARLAEKTRVSKYFLIIRSRIVYIIIIFAE